ncbi:uracil-DNA glycosylase [Candidatus Providencia siddallii]|uniref:Uracil-DNA glycosylase n=1 Tax=Candidatus Providencia siddallii TaxID=1715285 RepID=A0ABM9NPN6_9GAMM
MFNNATWSDFFYKEKTQFYFKSILLYLSKERKNGKIIYPSKNDIFNVFLYTELKDIKIVILGQDPYHGFGQAHGLSFSVKPGIKIPPSLINIYKELKQNISSFQIPNHGYLLKWAYQGVFLLNSILTVEHGIPNSHANIGWDLFTDKIILYISKYTSGVIFLLWGKYAQKKDKIINTNRHFILKASHPSPFSAYNGFFGCKHFLKSNDILIKQGRTPIDWTL